MVTLGMETVKKSGDLLVNRLKEYAGIEDVGFASTLVGASDVYSSNYFSYNNNGFGSEIIDVSWNFLDVKPMETTYWKPIKAVRNFRPEADKPKLPFNTSAGWKEVIYHAFPSV